VDVCCVPVLEALPPHAHRCIHAHEEEERAAEQRLYNLLIPYVRGHPVLSPSQRHEFEQRIDVWERALRVNWGRVGGRSMVIGCRLFHGGCRSGARKPYALEAVLLDEIGCDGRLARADSWAMLEGSIGA
jgi:hypothetical protein